MTIQDMVDEMNERGTFWWMVHTLNRLPIPDWLFLVMMIVAALTLVVGLLKVLDVMEEQRDQDFKARAARLGYMKADGRASGSNEDKALGYSTREMGELLELLDIFEGQVPEEERESARARLLATLEDAQLRREKLARQVERADEFLGILRERLS